MASLKGARERLEELGYDPIEALVEISRNRNQLAEVRLRAAMALLPYVYSQVPTKMDVNITRDTGVMQVPAPLSEEEWADQQQRRLANPNRIIDVGPDGKPLN